MLNETKQKGPLWRRQPRRKVQTPRHQLLLRIRVQTGLIPKGYHLSCFTVHIPVWNRPAWRSALTKARQLRKTPPPGLVVSLDCFSGTTTLCDRPTRRSTSVSWWLPTCREWPHRNVAICTHLHWFRGHGTVVAVSCSRAYLAGLST